MIKAVKIILMIILLTIPVYAADTAVAKDGTLQVNIPAGWNKEDASGTDVDLIIKNPVKFKNFYPNLNIVITRFPDAPGGDAPSSVLEDMVKNGQEKIKKSFPDAVYKNEKDLTVAGKNAKSFEGLFIGGKHRCHIKIYCFWKDKTIYVITGTTVVGNFATSEPVFDGIVNSIKFLK
ncbi:MAG: hypothetical protein ABIH00_06230 [Armatimonadota bacterium]